MQTNALKRLTYLLNWTSTQTLVYVTSIIKKPWKQRQTGKLAIKERDEHTNYKHTNGNIYWQLYKQLCRQQNKSLLNEYDI